MNKLIIHTEYPITVAGLLRTHQLADGYSHFAGMDLETHYPDDILSQAITFWLAMAQGCGLVESYELIHQGEQ